LTELLDAIRVEFTRTDLGMWTRELGSMAKYAYQKESRI
jgi:hypothetical protein